MRRILKIAAVVLGLLLAAVGALYASLFGGHAPILDGQRLEGVEVVKDGFVSCYLVDLGGGQVALVDACGDPAPVLAALKARKLGPDAVRAILLTHGDYDHTGGARAFPTAELMALAPDVALAEGRAVRNPVQSPKANGLKVARALADGEVLELGETRFEVFAIPGHTAGSAAILARGVLFLGDSAEAASGGKLEGCMWLFCDDRAQSRASVAGLAARLAPRAAEVKALAPAHSGVLVGGLAPLAEFAKRAAGGR